MRFFDYLSEFKKVDGIMSNLFTEISTSKEKNFVCTDLIDTPGLVDGDMQYPFDVQDAILHMAEHADMIMVGCGGVLRRCLNIWAPWHDVMCSSHSTSLPPALQIFLDPIGQATCKRTMQVRGRGLGRGDLSGAES